MFPEVRATRIIGPNPRGALGRVSLALRRALAECADAEAIVVGLSGGADSLALALAAIDACARAGVHPITVTVDHGLRAGSDAEAADVARLAESLGATAKVVRVDASGDEGPEGSARTARLEALAAQALQHNAPVMLGHTMDDQAETVLLRLARGSGAASLRAMSADSVDERAVRWMRPLLDLRRSDTEAACRAAGLTWVSDPTNEPDGPWKAKDGSPLRRSAVRSYALPQLSAALGCDPIPALAKSAELAARDDDALSAWARQAWGEAHTTAEVADGTLPALRVNAITSLPQAVRTRVLRRFALESGARAAALSLRHIDAVDCLVTAWSGQGAIALPGVSIERIRDLRGTAVLVATRLHTRPECGEAEGSE